MNDLISKKNAIEHLKKRLWETALNNEGEAAEVFAEIADDRLDTWMAEIRPAKQWIPASNPPKESGFYLVTVRRLYGIGELVIIKWFDSELNLWSMDNLYIPTAWMPLLEPYKEENNEQVQG